MDENWKKHLEEQKVGRTKRRRMKGVGRAYEKARGRRKQPGWPHLFISSSFLG